MDVKYIDKHVMHLEPIFALRTTPHKMSYRHTFRFGNPNELKLMIQCKFPID